MNEFPESEVFQDFRGKEVKFSYAMIDAGHIFSLWAREVTRSEYARQFCAYDGNSPINALYKIRRKIRAELNTRYFSEGKGRPFVLVVMRMSFPIWIFLWNLKLLTES
jgi:hypothetical protein